jgi:hypothetical protein
MLTPHLKDRHWIGHFSYTCLLKIIDQAFAIHSPTYATILHLDRLVREGPMPSHIHLVNVGHHDYGMRTGQIMQRNVSFVLTQKGMRGTRRLRTQPSLTTVFSLDVLASELLCAGDIGPSE